MSRSDGLMFKNTLNLVFFSNAVFHFTKMLIDGMESYMVYLLIIMIFLSAVWTFILTAPIHYRGSIGEQVIQICSDEETKSSTS